MAYSSNSGASRVASRTLTLAIVEWCSDGGYSRSVCAGSGDFDSSILSIQQ